MFSFFSTLNVKNLSLSGTVANPVNFKSASSGGNKAYISKNGGAVIVTGVNFTDIAFTGSAEFIAYQSPTPTRTTGITTKISKRPPSGFLIFC